MNEFDALIVGGRAAGGSLALLLARQGRNVLVVDRDEFPSDTMSTHFMNLGAVGALKRLRVLNDILGAGFRRVTRHRTWVGDCCFEGPAGPPGTFSMCPRRVVLDAVVLDRAAQPMPTELGTLDAIHLATALLWKEMTRVDLAMATHDGALALGAQAHGLPVVGVMRS